MLLEQDEDVSALDASPVDDEAALAGTLEDPESLNQPQSDSDMSGGPSEEIVEPNLDYHRDLSTLNQWTLDIDEMIEYFNGGADSVLGKLKAETKVGTIFDDVSDATKTDILDIVERMASLNQIFKHLKTEKHK